MFAKSIALFSILSFAATSIAAPTPAAQPVEARQAGNVEITLIDATNHQWPISIPSTQTWTPTNVQESISHVHITNTGNVPCAFFGVDNAVIVTFPGEVKDMDVGPPQTLVGGICGPWSPQ